MNYPFKLKFSSIQNLSDARYASGMWADFIGFCFDPNSTSYTDPKVAKEIISWVNGPTIIGEFGNQPQEWLNDFIEKFELKVIQLPQAYPHDLNGIKAQILLLEVNKKEINDLVSKADMLITSDEQVYQYFKDNTDKPIFLEITDLNIEVSELDGVSIRGQKEIKPGTSNQSEWTNFLEKYSD